jgi:hypothetical protein
MTTQTRALRGRVLAALAETGEGIGCHHYTVRRHGVDAALLVRLGVAGTIDRNPPACRTHGCPLCGECPHEALFSTKEPGRSRTKFRLTMSGLRVLAEPAALAEAARGTYVAGRVLDLLTDGPKTAPELNTPLLHAQAAELRSSGETRTTTFTRAELRDTLALLEECGLIREEAGLYAVEGAP